MTSTDTPARTVWSCKREHEDHDGELDCATARINRLDNLIIATTLLATAPLFAYLMAGVLGFGDVIPVTLAPSDRPLTVDEIRSRLASSMDLVEFDAWLARFKTRVEADALDSAAAALDEMQTPEGLPAEVCRDPALWLSDRACTIRAAAVS